MRPKNTRGHVVTPAKSGVQERKHWMPACAGMTNGGGLRVSSQWLATVLLSVAVVVGIVGCGRKPTQPDSAHQVKLEVLSLVGDIAQEVVSFRNKQFLRPITAAVYTRSEFKEKEFGNSPDGNLTETEKQTINKVLVCEGFLRPGDDYFAQTDTVLLTGIAGFYRQGTDSLFVVIDDTATSVSHSLKTTVFHELVHALQDQHFGLDALMGQATSSDHSYAIRYTVEGEAKYLDEFFSYRTAKGQYPLSAAPIDTAFQLYAQATEGYVDSLYGQGNRYFTTVPFLRAYYSYGPAFIAYVTGGMDWTQIDPIFTNLPVKTREVMHPHRYLLGYRDDYVVDMDMFLDSLALSHKVFDLDELGELLIGVLFKEWGVSDAEDIANGIVSDRIAVVGDSSAGSLSLCWYQVWFDSLEAAEFTANYPQLVETKRSTQLPPPVFQDSMVVVQDSSQGFYLEQSGKAVIVLENVPAGKLGLWLGRLQRATVSDWGAVPKAKAGGVSYPRVEKVRNKRVVYGPG